MKITMKDVMTANCQIPHAEMLTSNHCAALARELTAMFEAPVPPAGDVEVLAWMYQREGGEILGPLVAVESEGLKHKREGKRCEGRTILTPRSDCFDWRPLVDRAHVTRLTAERDGLLAAVKRLELHSHCHLQRAKIAEAELTKARELVARLWTIAPPLDDEFNDLVSACLAHQSAPAAKCGRCQASTVESCDEKGCGFLGAGNGAPSAKGGE